MSLRSRVQRILGKFDRRLVLVEDSVERIEAAVFEILEISTELKAKAANLEATAERLEVAVVEHWRTLQGALDGLRDEARVRAGVGRNVMHLSARVDELERKVPRGAAE